jgi:hypothetical protein
MIALFVLYLSVSQAGEIISLGPGLKLVSAREVVVDDSGLSGSKEHSLFELEGENLDVAFLSTDATSTLLVVDGSPCRYIRVKPRKGWCIVNRKVDFDKESISGPV